MIFPIKKFLFTFTFNISLFLILMIGIQNSLLKRKVNLVISETIKLPVSFIIGISFLSGSITGSLISVNNQKDFKRVKE